jgi:predicted phosphodiesterase
MLFAAIADIHGNRAALEAVLADLDALNIRDVVNLGDHLSGPLEAARTADLLIERGFHSIRGDQDRIMLELRAAGSGLRGDVRELGQRHVDWLAAMPPTLNFRDDVFLCHGSPDDDAAFWLDAPTADGAVHLNTREAIERSAAGLSASLILCAHTHIPRVVRLGDGRTIVNPGSVGLPGYTGTKPVPYKVETGTPDACYAILRQTREGWSATIRYVPYDSTRMVALARSRGWHDWASAIETGWIR